MHAKELTYFLSAYEGGTKRIRQRLEKLDFDISMKESTISLFVMEMTSMKALIKASKNVRIGKNNIRNLINKFFDDFEILDDIGIDYGS